MEPGEVAIGVAYLSGELRQRQIGVGYRSLRDLPAPAAQADARARRGRRGVRGDRRDGGAGLAGGAPRRAGRALRARHRARAALPRRAADRRAAPGRPGGRHGRGGRARGRGAARRGPARAACSAATSATTAAAALDRRRRGAARGRAAGRAPDPADARGAGRGRRRGARAKTGPAAIEYKLDGARLQVHRRGDEVRAFTRSLDDITARVPEVVEAVLALPARERRARRRGDRAEARRAPVPLPGHGEPLRDAAAPTPTAPLTPLFFDLLHVDGEDLIDRPGAERAAALDALVPAASRVPRALIADAPRRPGLPRRGPGRRPRGRRWSSRWRRPTPPGAAAPGG